MNGLCDSIPIVRSKLVRVSKAQRRVRPLNPIRSQKGTVRPYPLQSGV